MLSTLSTTVLASESTRLRLSSSSACLEGSSLLFLPLILSYRLLGVESSLCVRLLLVFGSLFGVDFFDCDDLSSTRTFFVVEEAFEASEDELSRLLPAVELDLSAGCSRQGLFKGPVDEPEELRVFDSLSALFLGALLLGVLTAGGLVGGAFERPLLDGFGDFDLEAFDLSLLLMLAPSFPPVPRRFELEIVDIAETKSSMKGTEE